MWDVSTHTPFYDPFDNLGGSGWQIHMGKVLNPDGQGSPNLLRDNPVLMMPDGSITKFFNKSRSAGLISKERWIYRAVSWQEWEVTTTDGTRYLFDLGSGVGYADNHGRSIAQCTRITDVNGNQITIEYKSARLYQITDTVGRTVEFEYFSGAGPHRIRFITVKYGGEVLQTWEYRYLLQATINQPAYAGWSIREVYALTEVHPPETSSSGEGAWAFEYYGTEKQKGTGLLPQECDHAGRWPDDLQLRTGVL